MAPGSVDPRRSSMADIKRVGVLGCGLMGSGIAQGAAARGYATVARDVSKDIGDRARAGIEKSLAKFVEKGKLAAADRDAALQRFRYTTTVADLKSCDIIIEAVTEDLEVKNALWKELDALCAPPTIFASNTSSLKIAAMAAATKRRDRFVGLHFFNPVPLILLDFVGLDTTFKIAEIMFAEYQQPHYAPPPLLKRMVLAGMYGKKSGKGFYDYSATPPVVSNLGL